jgi:hypothetical protein
VSAGARWLLYSPLNRSTILLLSCRETPLISISEKQKSCSLLLCLDHSQGTASRRPDDLQISTMIKVYHYASVDSISRSSVCSLLKCALLDVGDGAQIDSEGWFRMDVLSTVHICGNKKHGLINQPDNTLRCWRITEPSIDGFGWYLDRLFPSREFLCTIMLRWCPRR